MFVITEWKPANYGTWAKFGICLCISCIKSGFKILDWLENKPKEEKYFMAHEIYIKFKLQRSLEHSHTYLVTYCLLAAFTLQ
jgi:hypothetical protein